MKLELLENNAAKKSAGHCFNAAWDLIEKKNRSDQDNRDMLMLAHSSLWLWHQTDDNTQANLSVGCWQISRIYAILNDADRAILFAKRSIEHADEPEIDGFYLAYAFEALARGYKMKQQFGDAKNAVERAKEALSSSKEREVAALLQDLDEIEKWG